MRPALSGKTSSSSMRVMFVLYTLFIVGGIVFFVTIGITQQ